jgi:hypothetical protein
MEIKLTPQESESYFYNALCNGIDYVSGYGLEFNYKSEDYQKAKKVWAKANPDSSPCREDIWLQILRNGGELTLIDHECEGEYTKSINIKHVHERVQLTEVQHLLDMRNENDDATTADCILQTCFYEEIIFG